MDSPQQVCETYPAFLSKVFEMALDPDPAMTGVALDTLGLLGSTVEGKQVIHKTGRLVNLFFPYMIQTSSYCVHIIGNCTVKLLKYSEGENLKAVLLRMSQLASTGATELRVRSLDAISQLLTLQVCVLTYQRIMILAVQV